MSTLRRTPFKRPVYERPARALVVPVTGCRGVIRPVSGEVIATPKSEPVRSRPYRMWVASLPCISCGVVGHSQAAHSNSPEHGKSGSRKADDDAIFPLCSSRFGRPGCHADFDSGSMFTKDQRRLMTQTWIQYTRQRAVAAGWRFIGAEILKP